MSEFSLNVFLCTCQYRLGWFCLSRIFRKLFWEFKNFVLENFEFQKLGFLKDFLIFGDVIFWRTRTTPICTVASYQLTQRVENTVTFKYLRKSETLINWNFMELAISKIFENSKVLRKVKKVWQTVIQVQNIITLDQFIELQARKFWLEKMTRIFGFEIFGRNPFRW